MLDEAIARARKQYSERHPVSAALDVRARKVMPGGNTRSVLHHAEDDRVLELLFHHLLADGLYIARRGFIALSFEIGDAECDQLVASIADWMRRPL